jgi:hypothetical protein
MKKNRQSGRIMLVMGLLMILISAFSYIFDGQIKSPAFTIIGLVFIALGQKAAHKYFK